MKPLLMFTAAIAILTLAALVPPTSSTAQAADDGATTFATYCSTCHGTTGKGDGPAAAALDPKPADFSTEDFWKTRDDAAITKVIKEGGAAVGKSPLMAAWGAILSDEQITAVVAHMKTLKGK